MGESGEDARLTEREALALLNRLRSNIVATQSASWSNSLYPLVAILNAAGYEVMGATEGQREEHMACYGGSGRMPTLVAETPAPESFVGTTGLRREDRDHDGSLLIHQERWRQIETEGWTPEHDDEHTRGQMARAAIWYAHRAVTQVGWNTAPSLSWPWAQDWWKPSDDPIRNLVKAGALIAAEIDRLTRAERDSTPPRDPDRDAADTDAFGGTA